MSAARWPQAGRPVRVTQLDDGRAVLGSHVVLFSLFSDATPLQTGSPVLDFYVVEANVLRRDCFFATVWENRVFDVWSLSTLAGSGRSCIISPHPISQEVMGRR